MWYAVAKIAGIKLCQAYRRQCGFDAISLLPITARQSALFPGTAEAGIATIRVARLADEVPVAEIAAPALLKLDVQGFCFCVGGPPPGRWGGRGIRGQSRRGAAPTGALCLGVCGVLFHGAVRGAVVRGRGDRPAARTGPAFGRRLPHGL